MKSCQSCCSKTALKDSAAMSSAKQPELDLGAIGEQEQEQEGGTVIKEV